MATRSAPRRYTYEDFAALPDDGKRYELLDGELLVTPSPARRHQIITRNLMFALCAAIRQPEEGLVLHEFDVVFTPFRAVRPDVLFISAERMGRCTERCMEGAPDLIAEVLSPGNESHDLVRKLDWYQIYGVPEYWVLDPDRPRVRVHLHDGDRFRPAIFLEGPDTLTTALLPRLAVRVEALYEGIPGS